MIKYTILPITLILSCSIAFANPESHFHGEREHSHALPEAGVAHQHGDLPIGRLSTEPSKTKTIDESSPVADESTPTAKPVSQMSNMDKLLMKEYIDTSIRLQASMSLGEHGSWDEINKNRKKVKNNMKKNCVKLADRMQNRYPSMKVYSYTLNNCVQLSFSQLD